MLISYLARIFGALGLMALGLYALLAVFVPEVPGISWVGAGGAVAVTFWVYFDWEPITRFVGSRGGREQMVSWGLMLVAAGICGMVLHIGERKPKRWDFTEGRIHSLNSKTEQILTDIPAGLEVEIKGYYRSSFDSEEVAQRKAFERLGDAIQSTGSSVDFQLIDPEYSPLKASRDGVTSNGTVIVTARPEGGDDNAGRSERLQVPDEAELANALIRVISSRKSTIYWISGHGERSPETRGELSTSLLTGHLVNLGFEVKSWSSLKETEVPSDATVLILAAPKVPLDEREAGMIREWVEEGGSLMVLSEPQMPGQESAGTGLEGAMLSWGLRLRDDLAIDPIMSRLGGDPAAPIADRFGSHEITKGIDLGVVFVTARSVEEQSADAEQVTVFELARTSDDSWGETELTSEEIGPGPSDSQGPLALVALAELHRPGQEASGRVLVAGDADWISDAIIPSLGNLDFATRSIGYLAKAEDIVKIPARENSDETLELSVLQILLMIFGFVFFVPGVTLLAGIMVWIWRRNL